MEVGTLGHTAQARYVEPSSETHDLASHVAGMEGRTSGWGATERALAASREDVGICGPFETFEDMMAEIDADARISGPVQA
ncbi:MAG: hypothetical protein IJR14_03720 [Synergistaceae bacterium]|nr:hypothetical protein [Synergistaceae bacterium]